MIPDAHVTPELPVPEAPAVTFAIPFYSGIEYLTRALRSILAQDDPSWHAIVVDDGEDPSVEAVVASVGQGRIRYLRNPHNLGLAGNFNRCLDVADTELVTVLHADDELMPSYTRTMRAAARRHPDAAAFFCRATIIGPDSKPRFSLADVVKDRISPIRDRELVLSGEPGVRALLKANFIVAPTLCFRKPTLGARRFPAAYKFVLDWELTTALLLDGESLVGLPERCYWYRRHEDNATEHLTRSQQRFHEESAYYDRIAEIARARAWPRCVELASAKRIVKLNVTYRALKSAAQLRFGEARRGLMLLREL